MMEGVSFHTPLGGGGREAEGWEAEFVPPPPLMGRGNHGGGGTGHWGRPEKMIFPGARPSSWLPGLCAPQLCKLLPQGSPPGCVSAVLQEADQERPIHLHCPATVCGHPPSGFFFFAASIRYMLHGVSQFLMDFGGAINLGLSVQLSVHKYGKKEQVSPDPESCAIISTS